MSRLVGVAMRAATAVLSVPPLRTTRLLARTATRAASLLSTDAEHITRTNLGRCFPELDEVALAALVRSSLGHTACLVAETGMLGHWRAERIDAALCSIDGLDELREIRAGGRGVLLLAPHFGNWEVLTYVLGADRMLAVYEPPRIEGLDGPIRTSRERFGARLVPTDRPGLRAVYRTLREGGLAGILPDQVPERGSGVYAPFFGHPALTMLFGHRLIQASRPHVVLGWARRVERGFAVRFEPAPDAIYDPDPLMHASALNRSIEQLVRSDPAQYQWEYKRFKRQPEGQPGVYSKSRVRRDVDAD